MMKKIININNRFIVFCLDLQHGPVRASVLMNQFLNVEK